MNWHAVRNRFSLFDATGLHADTVLTLRLMIASVAFGIVWTNITTGVALTGYLKDLGASDFLYGIVFALPAIANSAQFVCSYILERLPMPRRLYVISCLIQRLIWIPFGLIPFFVPLQAPALRVWAAVLMAFVSALMAPMMSVAFYSIAAEAVPIRIRGRYFATRSRVSTMMGLIVGLIVGMILDRLPGFTGYAIVFAIAGVFGALDGLCYLGMKSEPKLPVPTKENVFRMMGSVFADKRYMKTVIALAAWVFAVYTSSPYYNVYTRTVLNLSNTDIIMTGQIANNVLLILLITRWGRAIDQYGNKPILLIAAFLSSFLPVWWLRVSSGMLLLMACANAYSGGIYCAVDLTMQNLFMGQAKSANRSMYFAVYFIFTQLLGQAFGSAAGGWMLDNVFAPVDGMGILLGGVAFTRYNALFLLSAILRLAVVVWLIPRIEDEDAQPVGSVVRAGLRNTLYRLHGAFVGIRMGYLRKKYHRETRIERDREH